MSLKGEGGGRVGILVTKLTGGIVTERCKVPLEVSKFGVKDFPR